MAEAKRFTADQDGQITSAGDATRPRSSAVALAPRWATIGLFIIALFYTFYFAAPVLVPITIAILLSVLLSPAVEWLERLRLPRAVASAIIVAGALGLIVTAVVTLAGPAQDWVVRLPASFDKLEQRLKLIKKPIAEIQRATEQIENATELSQKSPQRRQIVELRRPSFAGELLSGTQRAMTSVGIVIILMFFLLATGDLFLRKLVALMPSAENKARTVDIARSVKKDISFYLQSLTVTNLGYGVLVTCAGWALGLENAPLWGAVTAILSFAPYVGPVVILILLSMASLRDLHRHHILGMDVGHGGRAACRAAAGKLQDRRGPGQRTASGRGIPQPLDVCGRAGRILIERAAPAWQPP
jgi:predicted PurR-regulated permease PerM